MMFAGVGKSRTVYWVKVFLAWPDVGEVISKPANSRVLARNTDFSGLRMMSLWPQMLSHSNAWKNLSVRLSAQRSLSSRHLVLLGI